MRTTKRERARWAKFLGGGVMANLTPSEAHRLIDDVDEATALLGDVLAEMPPMQWLIEQGGLSTEDAPRFAQRIGDAYVFLEEPSDG
jgi:hypothetical protein